jgi:hypothetical protein
LEITEAESDFSYMVHLKNQTEFERREAARDRRRSGEDRSRANRHPQSIWYENPLSRFELPAAS